MAFVVVFGTRTLCADVDRFEYAGFDWSLRQRVCHICCVPMCPVGNALLTNNEWMGNRWLEPPRGYHLSELSWKACIWSCLPCCGGCLTQCWRQYASLNRKLDLINVIREKRKLPKFGSIGDSPDWQMVGADHGPPKPPPESLHEANHVEMMEPPSYEESTVPVNHASVQQDVPVPAVPSPEGHRGDAVPRL